MTIVVSGIGLVTPLGMGRDLTWRRLINGESAIQPSPDGLLASIRDFSVNGARSRMGDLALTAAREALDQAGLLDQVSRYRIGCAVSQSKPVLFSHKDLSQLDTQMLLSTFFGWSSESVVKRDFQLQGPSANIAAACATGIASIDCGARWIESGECEIALVGASESSLNPLYRAGFRQMGVLVDGNQPEAVRPFDQARRGFTMGEGAAVIILEEEKVCLKRGGRPLASLLSVQMRHSSLDAIRFDPNGDSISRLVKQTLRSYGAPGYINAHGTGTVFNDIAEARGIRSALELQAGRVPVSSTKASTGHLLGAAGAVEAAFCVLSLLTGDLPPTLNLENLDPACDIDVIARQTRHRSISSAMSLSYGFGGQMGAVLFGKC